MTRRRTLAGAVLLTLLGFTAAAGSAAGATAAAAASPGAVTVNAPAGGKVTVDSTVDLVNQTVHVSWTGFKASSDTVVRAGSTEYVVRVYQCRGAAPTSPKACYGSSVYTYDGQTDRTQTLPDGPSNHRDAATALNGTGSVDLEVRTTLESSTLGCTADTACSLVVVPNYGDPKHKNLDFINATNSAMDSTWAWANHVAVPLTVAQAGDTCPLGVPGVTALGSPMLQRSVTSWQPTACSATTPVKIDYTALGEPEARSRYLAATGATVGLTSLPAAEPGRPTAYAPLAVSGVAVAFHVDDAVTGQPVNELKLSARLVAKLITESYGGVGYVAPGAPVGSGNPATAGNPYSIWVDREFVALNPGHAWPQTNGTNPLLVSGNTDLVWELTRWIDADAAARAWLDGAADQFGMHVNSNFRGIDYPATSLETRDPYPALSYTFVPMNGLDHVARSLVSDQPSSSSPTADEFGRHPKDPQQLPGARGLIAVIGTADAAAFSLPTAQLRNAAGSLVAPDATAMAAAVGHMTLDAGTGTRLADVSSTDPAAYPLTLVQYAMVPTGDLDAADTAEVVHFLEYAGGPGQVSGPTTGQLPAGYLPLGVDLRTQLAAVTASVRSQSGRPFTPGPTPSSTGTASVNPPASTSPTAPFSAPGAGPVFAPRGTGPVAAPAIPGVAATTSPPGVLNRPAVQAAATYSGAPGTGGFVRMLLPGLLVLSLLAGVGGPLLLSRGSLARGLRPRGWGVR